MKLVYESRLPDGWTEKPLGELVQLRRGYTWTKEDEVDRPDSDTVPVIRIPNIQKELDLSDLLHLRNVSPERLGSSAVTKGWILFVGSNGTQNRIGDSVLVDADRPMVFASFLMGMTSKDNDELLPEYLARWLRLPIVHEWFSKTSQQTTGLANFSWSAVKRLPVRFPADVYEQRRVAAALKFADDAITSTRDELKAFYEVKRSLMSCLFSTGIPGRHSGFRETRIGAVPDSWDVKKVKEVLTGRPINGYSPQSSPEPPGTKTVNVSCVRNGECDLSKVTYVDIDDAVVETLQVHQEDFFVLRGNGNRDYIGIGGLVRENISEPMIYSDLLFRMQFDEDQVVSRFVPYLWQTTKFLHRLQAKAKSGSGLWKIGKRDIENELIPVPPKPEQGEIVEAIEAAISTCFATERKLASLQNTQKSLLQELMTGRIRISEGVVDG